MNYLRYLLAAILVLITTTVFAEDITTEPLTPDTGTYAETPVSKPPKDPHLKNIWEEAEKGGYLNELERAIQDSGGTRLQEEWNKKEDD